MTAVAEPTSDAPSVAYCVSRFEEQCRRLAEPRLSWDAMTGRPWSEPSLFALVRSMTTAASIRSGASACGSRPPARIEVIDWTARITQEIGEWATGSVPEALMALAAAGYAPDDVEELQRRTAILARYVAEGEQLAGLAPVVLQLRGHRCPRCESVTAYRRSGNEQVRQAAISVSAEGAQCNVCRARWSTPQELQVLQRCLGITPAAEVG